MHSPLFVYYGVIIATKRMPAMRSVIPVIYASRKGDDSTIKTLRRQLLDDDIDWDSVEYHIKAAPPDFIQKVALDNTFHEYVQNNTP